MYNRLWAGERGIPLAVQPVFCSQEAVEGRGSGFAFQAKSIPFTINSASRCGGQGGCTESLAGSSHLSGVRIDCQKCSQLSLPPRVRRTESGTGRGRGGAWKAAFCRAHLHSHPLVVREHTLRKLRKENICPLNRTLKLGIKRWEHQTSV